MRLRDAAVIDVFVATMTWAALGYIVERTQPTLGARLVFLALLLVALTSLLLPVVAAIHAVVSRRLDESGLPTWLRQALLAALFSVVSLWLQMLRALNPFNALLLAGVLILLEVMILDRGSKIPPPAEEAPPD